MKCRSFLIFYQQTNTTSLAIENHFFQMLLPTIILKMSENKKPNFILTQVRTVLNDQIRPLFCINLKLARLKCHFLVTHTCSRTLVNLLIRLQTLHIFTISACLNHDFKLLVIAMKLASNVSCLLQKECRENTFGTYEWQQTTDQRMCWLSCIDQSGKRNNMPHIYDEIVHNLLCGWIVMYRYLFMSFFQQVRNTESKTYFIERIEKSKKREKSLNNRPF